jgi:hypothetical protein
MSDLTDLVGFFAHLLKPRGGNNDQLDDWITAARAADLATCTPSPVASTRIATPSTLA